MTRVLFVMPNWEAPSEVFLRRQMHMLTKAGLLAAVILPYQHGITSWNHMPVYSLAQPPRLRYQIKNSIWRKLGLKPPDLLKQFERAVHRTHADTVLIQYATLAVALRPVLEALPHRLFIHLHGGDTEHWHDETYRRSLAQLSQRAILLCASEEVRGRLKAWGVEARRCILKPLGVEVPDVAPVHTPTDTITILFLGRLIDCKSPDRTIQAFELACAQGLQGQLIIAGDGPLLTMCQLLRERSPWRDQIRLLGAVSKEEGDRLRGEADIFTQHAIRGELTGQVEAFGVSILEAMAAALPVVTCPVGGIKETVIDGETGIMTTPGSVEEQAAAFVRLARDAELRREIGLAGWRRARALYTLEAEERHLIAILSDEQIR